MLNFIFKKFSKEKKVKVHTVEIPDVPVGYALQAETNRKLKNFEQAMDYINKAIDIEQNNDMYWITKALIYRDIKNYGKAIETINKAIEINDSVQITKDIKQEISYLLEHNIEQYK